MKAVMYHYVRLENPSFPFFKFLHVKDFIKQVDFFQQKSEVLNPQILKDCVSNCNVPEGYVLTFDDGLKDHYDYVFPELKKRGLSAIFYIPTGFYENKKLLGVHRLHLLLGKYGGKEIYKFLENVVSLEMLNPLHQSEFDKITYNTHDSDEYTIIVKKMVNYFIDYKYQAAILDTLMTEFFDSEEDLGNDFYLSAAEIKEMHDAGMMIGSHTKTHPVMSRISIQEQEDEIRHSFNWIESVVGKSMYKTFCYPYGTANTFTKETGMVLSKEGIDFSFVVDSKNIDKNNIAATQFLPRFDCNEFAFGKAFSKSDNNVKNDK